MRLILLAAVIMLAVFIACQPSSRQQDVVLQYRTGSVGLRLNFVPGLPPPRLFDSEEFNTVIEIYNEGAFDVGGPGDKIYLSGFDPNLITGVLLGGEQISQIEGKSQFSSKGGIDTASFKGVINKQAVMTERLPFNLLATACYTYETIATAAVCIDPDPFSTTLKQKACRPQNVGLGTQGAPVAVTGVEIDSRPGKTMLRLIVQNVGGGDVFRYGGLYLQLCSPFADKGLGFDDVDYVQVVDVYIAGKSISSSCKPRLDSGHLRLVNGRGVLYCEVSSSVTSAFTTPLTVSLRYGYRNQLMRAFEILKSS